VPCDSELEWAASATTTADASGNYSFTGLANGSYTVTPSKAGFTFTPASQAVTINGANQTGVNFTASAVTFRISGSISNRCRCDSELGVGRPVLRQLRIASGNYSFTGLANGSYTVTPSKAGFTFTPASQA